MGVTRGAPVHAAILAAGLSSRFGGGQKALHRLGGRTLLERSLRGLLDEGVASISVVTGHRREDVERSLASLSPSAGVVTVHNDRYGEWNNFYSVELACDRVPDGDLLVVNGDVIYDAAALQTVLGASGADLYLAVSDDEVDDEAMKVAVEGQRVVALGKPIRPSEAAGEFIGISRLTPSARSWYVAVSRWARTRGLTSHYYEDVYDALVGNLAARCCAVDADGWAEIDESADLARAQAVAERVDAAASVSASRADAPPA